MSSTTQQQQKSLGPYQNLYQEAVNQKDHQKALKYLLQVTNQNPEQDKLWNQEIIECLMALRLYNLCSKRVIETQKANPKSSPSLNLSNLEILINCHLGMHNFAKANEILKLMEGNLTKLQAESSDNQSIEAYQKRISDLKLKTDTCQIVTEEQRKQEARSYKRLEDIQESSQIFKEPDQEVYLIPTQWMNKWKEYSFYKEQFEQSDNMEDENENKKTFDQIYPGPIDASILVEPSVKNHIFDTDDGRFFENYVLKSDKAEKHDFEIVSRDIADFFYQIYGGFKVQRYTIDNPVTKEVNVELFFKKINFIPTPSISPLQTVDSIYTIYISKFATLQQLNDKIKRALKNVPQIQNSIWNRQYYKFWKLSQDLQKNHQSIHKVLKEKYKEPQIQLDVKEILLGQDELVEDMQLTENQIILYELSQTEKFKIVPAPLRKQSSKIEQENNEDDSQKSTYQSSIASEMLDESEEQEGFPTGKIKIRRIDDSHVRNMLQKFRIQNGQKGFSGKKGLCGLQNLGNTCFMNSSLQCLSNVEELTTFMVNNDYVNDLNPDNPLGASGHLAVSYADLVRDIWQGNDSYVSPHYLKKVIGKFAPQFYGYSQQDSQELLSYLLDGLQEDLNRIKKKPIVEAIDYSGGDDDKMALEFFKNYKKRNDSVISDLMVGQFKSTLVCPDKHCGKVSITFDPFLTLSVPIPRVTKEEDHRKTPLKIETLVRSDSSLSELKQVICENLNIPPQCLVFVNNCQSIIDEILCDSERAVHIKEISGICFAYEVEKQALPIKNILQQQEVTAMDEEEEEPSQSKKITPVLQNDGDQADVEEEEEKNSQTQKKKSISTEPFVYTEIEFCQIYDPKVKLSDKNIAANSIHNVSYSRLISMKHTSTVKDLYLQIYKILRVYLQIYQEAKANPQINVEINITDDSIENLQKELEQFENSSDQKYLFSIFNKDMTPLEPNNANSLLSLRYKNKDRLLIKVVFDYNFEMKLMRTKRCVTHSFEAAKTSKEPTSNDTNLYSCIDAFVKKEQLEKGNEWYCNKCKKHVLATKQMEIYKTPKILIIHLKRFKSGNVRNYGRYYFESGGKKIGDHIDFPIEDLDMTKYVLGANGKQQIYDLFAVSQHYGGMGGGHYTACAQNFINKRWYNFNDSHVSQTSPDQAVSSAAYVLFYRRRD